MELYDPNHPRMPLTLPSPPPPPNPLVVELQKDAENFDRGMRKAIMELQATRASEIVSKAAYLKAAETHDAKQLRKLHKETDKLEQETAARFKSLEDMLDKHGAFLAQVAAALRNGP